jgi:hypothetical protein
MSQVKNITIGRLFDLCEQHKYLLLRTRMGEQVGLNCGVSKIAKRRLMSQLEKETNFISFQACGLNEYINNKVPFV